MFLRMNLRRSLSLVFDCVFHIFVNIILQPSAEPYFVLSHIFIIQPTVGYAGMLCDNYRALRWLCVLARTQPSFLGVGLAARVIEPQTTFPSEPLGATAGTCRGCQSQATMKIALRAI